jgi:hypothetical protein
VKTKEGERKGQILSFCLEFMYELAVPDSLVHTWTLVASGGVFFFVSFSLLSGLSLSCLSLPGGHQQSNM